MLRISIVAIVVAAGAAFVASTIWYIVFGKALRQLSPSFADMKKAPLWKKVAVVVQSLVIALVVASLTALLNITSWTNAVSLAVWLWIGFSAMQWAGSILWENVPLKLAAIHAGDWLVKLIVIAIIVTVLH